MKEFYDAIDTELFGKKVAVTQDGAVYIHSYTDKVGKLHKGKWMKSHLSRGYLRYSFRQDGEIYTMKRHQVTMKVWGVPAPEGMEDPTIDHIDGDKLNNHIDNLQWLTRGDNVRKAYGYEV